MRRRSGALAPSAALLCRDCGSRRCAYYRPDPRRPASASRSRSRGRAATIAGADLAPGLDETEERALDRCRRLLRLAKQPPRQPTATTTLQWKGPRRREGLLRRKATTRDVPRLPSASLVRRGHAQCACLFYAKRECSPRHAQPCNRRISGPCPATRLRLVLHAKMCICSQLVIAPVIRRLRDVMCAGLQHEAPAASDRVLPSCRAASSTLFSRRWRSGARHPRPASSRRAARSTAARAPRAFRASSVVQRSGSRPWHGHIRCHQRT